MRSAKEEAQTLDLVWKLVANPSGLCKLETIIQIVHIITSLPFPLSPAVHFPWAQLCPAANGKGQASTELTNHSEGCGPQPSPSSPEAMINLDRVLSPLSQPRGSFGRDAY